MSKGPLPCCYVGRESTTACAAAFASFFPLFVSSSIAFTEPLRLCLINWRCLVDVAIHDQPALEDERRPMTCVLGGGPPPVIPATSANPTTTTSSQRVGDMSLDDLLGMIRTVVHSLTSTSATTSSSSTVTRAVLTVSSTLPATYGSSSYIRWYVLLWYARL